HAIGDRAIEFALNVIEKAGAGMNISGMRNRIEHCVLPTDKQLSRIKENGIVVGSSFGFIYALGEGYLNALGPERVKAALPQKSYQDLGIIAPGNTDCPVCDVNPLLAIYAAVTRKSIRSNSLGEKQRVDPQEALRSYTTYAAYSTFDEDKIGSIKEGKLADMVVLEKNLLLEDPEEIKDIKVSMTIMNGKIVWRSGTV
ncbi:MAG: amidohydrolase family protein, partial [Eubacteriales bacterium]|nr:amidohydrolase family protein [Eubacteriales bacterium]